MGLQDPHLGDREQHVVGEVRIVAAEVLAADDAVAFALYLVDLARRTRQPHHEFLEERSLESLPNPALASPRVSPHAASSSAAF